MEAHGKDYYRFLGMGLPWFFIAATAAAAFPAVVYMRKNAENAFAEAILDASAYRDRFIKTVATLVACAANIVLCGFLFFSAGAQYALATALLTVVGAASIFHPSRFLYSRQIALGFALWQALLSGTVFMTSGVLDTVSMCNAVYNTYADVMCVEGWVTFTVFCAILMNGFTFLLSLLFIEIAVADSGRADEAKIADGEYSSIGGGYGAIDDAPTAAAPVASVGAPPSKEKARGSVPDSEHYERIADDE